MLNIDLAGEYSVIMVTGRYQKYFTVWNKSQSSKIQCSEGCIILHSWVPMVWLTVNSISSLLQSKEFRTKWFPEAMVIVSIMTESSFNTQVDLGSFLFTRICSTCFSGRSPSHCPATVERVRKIDIKKHYMKHNLSIHLINGLNNYTDMNYWFKFHLLVVDQWGFFSGQWLIPRRQCGWLVI